VDDPERDDLEPTYELFSQRTRPLRLILPVVLLLVVIAIVSGLVFGGVIQGHESRTGPTGVPTTQPTVIISP
jgi:hypothetical protein